MENYHDEKTKLRIFEMIRELPLPKTGWVLDFGSGNGDLTELLRKTLPGWKVFGTDISSQAISNARKRYSHLNFFNLADKTKFERKFDFLFSFHVLEHVFDLKETWNTMDSLLKPTSIMLHILPCGNKGSLGHRFSSLVRNGINKKGRFFYETVGHLQRPSTKEMNLIAREHGFCLFKEFYGLHYWTAIEKITTRSPWYILNVYDPKRGKNEEAKIQVKRLRNKLFLITILRLPVVLFDTKWYLRRSKLEAVFLFLFLSMLYPFSYPINFYVNKKAEQEWNLCKTKRNGGDMYLFYERP